MTKLTSRELDRRSGRAKRAAVDGPVVITDRGRPAYVLMTFKDYERFARTEISLAEALAGPDDFDWEAPELRDDSPRIVDLD